MTAAASDQVHEATEPSAADTGAAAMPELKYSIAPEELAELLRQAGFRAALSLDGQVPRIQSAAQGLGFFVSFSNPELSNPSRFIDFTFQCPLSLRGALSPQVLLSWNGAKRFARLSSNDELLVLAMDVLVAGGVSDLHLRAQCELWDLLIQQLLLHLKQPIDPGDSQTAAPAAVAG